MQSLLLSQSPSDGPQGCEVEQHDHKSVVQSHPENVSINKKDVFQQDFSTQFRSDFQSYTE